MLTAQYVEYIHDQLIAQLWPGTAPAGPGGVRDGGLLESAVARPFHSAFGVDAYPTINSKAEVLFHSLIANHPFQDGNKRTAAVSLDHFLLANGYFQTMDNDSLYRFAQQTASYRERGISHKEVLQEINAILMSNILFFADLRMLVRKDRLFLPLLEHATRSRVRIRLSKLNHLIPAE
jgi:death-on-curing family protein